jgi:hypothetical protein
MGKQPPLSPEVFQFQRAHLNRIHWKALFTTIEKTRGLSPVPFQTHRAACAAPLSFADHQEMQLHQRPDLKVLAFSPPDHSGKGKLNGTICCVSRKLTTAPSVASASSNAISFGMALRRPRQRKFRQVPGTSSALCHSGSWGAHQPGFVYVLVVDTG